MNVNTDEFFGIVKRKDMLGLLGYIFKEIGEDDAAEVVGGTTRFTAAAVDRMRKALKGDPEEAPCCDPEESIGALPNFEAKVCCDAENEIADQFADLDKLIAKGKKKKAKKLYAAMEESGLTGDEMEKRKKEIKGL